MSAAAPTGAPTPAEALAALEALGDRERAAGAAAYHKARRRYLGVSVPQIDALARDWRQGPDLGARLQLADALWRSDIHEARIAAARLLTQARIRPDDRAAWDLVASWVPQFDAWAIADHVAKAGERRLLADPARLDQVETWLEAPNMWQRRAALIFTLPWTKIRNPKPEDLARRDRILGWAARLAGGRDWFEQKAVAWWIRDLSRHDAPRARTFLDAHGGNLKGFARKEAAKYLHP
ncbi:DNA alkylation repair enzyme [Defluviimonas sp. 20V17]|uniref:3-methyladenine DNA glycosylase AlkD n=1 Tax=Allgaiera indica TaxID=765699 RepID=A0AAN4US62_9RHOB|nr:DNA alkylation repair protein [Allgaiera indica]KDB02252.1 DNA alkylation repair enzyme [Defluviimonas sp. 20V17]GHE02746.1 DNA alkylation repair protein [Allgaiera indica]SDX18340.1 3-methyladenine DNA glycosylase AlkD [Allgaiera indica]